MLPLVVYFTGEMGGWVSFPHVTSGCQRSTMANIASDFTFRCLRVLLDVGGHQLHLSLHGHYLVVMVALSLCWSWPCSYSHSHHHEFLVASPSLASQPRLGGVCKELDLEALAKALPTIICLENYCGPYHSSPRWECCRRHQIHLATPCKNLVCLHSCIGMKLFLVSPNNGITKSIKLLTCIDIDLNANETCMKPLALSRLALAHESKHLRLRNDWNSSPDNMHAQLLSTIS
jgi:hypothetical protein